MSFQPDSILWRLRVSNDPVMKIENTWIWKIQIKVLVVKETVRIQALVNFRLSDNSSENSLKFLVDVTDISKIVFGVFENIASVLLS